MAEVWAGLAPEERLDLKLLSLLEHDLDGDDMRLLPQLARRRWMRPARWSTRCRRPCDPRTYASRTLSGTLDSVWGWLVLRRRELQDVDRQLDELRDQSTAVATALARTSRRIGGDDRQAESATRPASEEIRGFKVTTPYKDIARLKGSTVGTVCSRLFRLRERLAARCSRRGGSAMTHLDVMTLSQLLDGELEHAAPAEAHLASCPACGTRLARVRDASAAVRAAGNAAGPRAAAAAPPCPTPSRLVGWLDATTPASEREALGGHLDACDVCLGEVLAAARIMGRLDAAPLQEVPAPLLARVAAQWPAARPAPSLTTVVVELARRSVRLVERHLVAPIADLVEVAAPAAAVRAGAERRDAAVRPAGRWGVHPHDRRVRRRRRRRHHRGRGRVRRAAPRPPRLAATPRSGPVLGAYGCRRADRPSGARARRLRGLVSRRRHGVPARSARRRLILPAGAGRSHPPLLSGLVDGGCALHGRSSHAPAAWRHAHRRPGGYRYADSAQRDARRRRIPARPRRRDGAGRRPPRRGSHRGAGTYRPPGLLPSPDRACAALPARGAGRRRVPATRRAAGPRALGAVPRRHRFPDHEGPGGAAGDHRAGDPAASGGRGGARPAARPSGRRSDREPAARRHGDRAALSSPRRAAGRRGHAARGLVRPARAAPGGAPGPRCRRTSPDTASTTPRRRCAAAGVSPTAC